MKKWKQRIAKEWLFFLGCLIVPWIFGVGIALVKDIKKPNPSKGLTDEEMALIEVPKSKKIISDEEMSELEDLTASKNKTDNQAAFKPSGGRKPTNFKPSGGRKPTNPKILEEELDLVPIADIPPKSFLEILKDVFFDQTLLISFLLYPLTIIIRFTIWAFKNVAAA